MAEVEETGSRKSSNKSTVNSKSKELLKRKSLVLSMSSIDEDILTTDSENSNSLYTSKKQRQLMVMKVNEKANSIIDMESITSVVSASFVITSNTVGAGMLCLPEAAASPIGMFPALIVFFGIYCVNLISGLAIGELVIAKFEESMSGRSNASAPSSFKDLADDIQFGSINGGDVVSFISVMINWLVLTFAIMRAATLVDFASLSDSSLAIGISAFLTSLISTQSTKTLTQISSVLCTMLFISYGFLLVPGFMNMQTDILATIQEPGQYANQGKTFMEALGDSVPFILTTMVYQNIVPTIAKVLQYDRVKTTAALVIGSGIPAVMYILWCIVALGGGAGSLSDSDLSNAASLSTLMVGFLSFFSISGSSIACVISLSEEFISQLPVFTEYLSSLRGDEIEKKVEESRAPVAPTGDEIASVPSVLLAVVPSVAAGILFSNDQGLNSALELAGSYGSPLLYGVFPVLCAWQNREIIAKSKDENTSMIPGNAFSLVLLGISSMALVGQSLINEFSF